MTSEEEILFNEVQSKRSEFLKVLHEYWSEHAFMTWQWWLLLVTTIFIWIVWLKVVDKTRIHLLLNYGLIIGIIALTLDMVGINYGAWAYPVWLYWAFIPPLVTFDLSYLPVIFMLLYQRFGEKWTYYLVALLFASGFISFIIEPLFHWIGIYETYRWKYIYSFPIYILIACFAKVLVESLSKMQYFKE